MSAVIVSGARQEREQPRTSAAPPDGGRHGQSLLASPPLDQSRSGREGWLAVKLSVSAASRSERPPRSSVADSKGPVPALELRRLAEQRAAALDPRRGPVEHRL